jgi:hypothetical protein
MDMASAQRLVLLIVTVIIAYLTAEILSGLVVRILHLSGTAGFIVSFILFAAIFFGVMSLFQRVLKISLFDLDYR